MKKISVFQVFFALAIAALFLCGQQSFAANKHWVVKNVPHSDAKSDLGAAPAGLFGAGAQLVTTSLNQPGNPFTGPWPGTNYPTGAPTDLWPCFGGEGTAQPDCAYIGSTGTSDPASLGGSAVLGAPSYTWYLDANTSTSQPYGCNASSAADEFHFCAQAVNWYEDDSNDTTDDLIWSMTVKQGSAYIYDSGTNDYGPNPYGGYLAADGVAPVIIFYEDLNFGTLGQTGPNNGNCFASYNYPINNAPNPYVYGEFNTFAADWGIAGGKTCVAPVPGLAVVSITTELQSPTYTELTNTTKKPDECPGEPLDGTCYTVKYGAAKYKLTQTFDIWLR